MDWKQVKEEIIARRKAIWFDKPTEITRLENGDIDAGTAVYGQCFTVEMFAEGEMRTLSDEVLWHLRQTAGMEGICLDTLKKFAKSILTYKYEFLLFVGLPDSSTLLQQYVECLDTVQTAEEFIELTDEMIVYVNRAHMWVDMIFPWGVSMGFVKNN